MTAVTLALTVHLWATLWMGGLIWFVQCVHYPMLAALPEEGWVTHARRHQRRTARVVVPLMLAELGGAVAVWILVGGTLALVGLGLLGLIWLSTFALQVPLHRRLAGGMDRSAAERLVRGNWIRTVAWTLRTPVAIAMWVGAEGVR